MCKKSLLMMLLLALLVPWAAQAQVELTVYDGDATNGNVPVYGFYADAYNKAEMIMSADELSDMAGGTISGLTWYLASPATQAWGGNFQVYLAEVTDATFTTFLGVDNATLVWEGPLDGTGSTIEIEFDNNYTYGGGNLFIAVYQTATGTYKSAQFAGEAVTSASISNYSYSGLDDITSGTARDFLPKTTFTYIPAGGSVCEKPATFEVTDITGYAATCTWESEVGNYTFEWKKASETDWTVVSGLTATTYQLDNLEPFTVYNTRVKAVCGTDSESGYKTANFTTLDVCPDGLVCIGEGTATNSYLPTYFYYNYSLTEQIYTADEIGTAGAIESVDIYSVGTGTRTLEIYMVSTEKRAFEGDDWIPATASDLVFSGEVTFAANSWNTFEFDNPFIYNGTSNVALIVRDMTGSYVSGIQFFVFEAESQALYAYRDASEYDLAAPGVTGTVLSVKNRVRFAIGEPPACPKPTGLAVNYEGGTSATFTWTENGTATSWDLQYSTDAEFNEYASAQVDGTPSYELTGLELATTYYVRVNAFCEAPSEYSTTISFTTDACMPENKCALTFVVTDSYGDGWNGASIDIYDYTGETLGDLLASITNQNLDGLTSNTEETQTLTYNFCDGQELAFIWTSGSFDSEASYTVTDLNGDVVVEGSGEGFDGFAYTMNCTVTDCRKPTDFAASEIGNHSVVLSWTENGPATEWVIAYISENDEEISYITTSENPYTLTGLDPETMYAAQVTPVCEVEKPSEVIYWTTDVACPKPYDMNVMPYPFTADVAWEGFADAYDLEWALLPASESKDPYNDENWYYYDNGTYVGSVGLGGGEFHWGVMFPAGTYEGTLVSKVKAYDINAMVGTLAIYNDGETAPANQISIQDVEFTGAGDWVEFETYANIDPTKNVWVVFDAVDGAAYPIGTSNDDNGDANGRWVEINGTWYDMANVGVTGRANMLRAYIELGVDPEELEWNPVSGITSPYTIEGLQPETTYIVRVKALCGGEDGESAWTTMTFTTPSACDAAIDLTAEAEATSANLSWTGYQDSYNLKYWSPGHMNAFNETDFTQVGEDIMADSVLTTYNFDLSAFSGVGNIAIRHYNVTDQFRLNVDDIVVTNAQGEEIVNEDFESGEINLNWINYDNDGDGFVWDIWHITQLDADSMPVGNGEYCATSASYNSYGALEPDNWLIIPNVELGGTLTFVARGQDPAWSDEIFGVFVSTTELYVPGTDPVIVEGVTNPYELTGLTPETPYAFQVQGINAECDSIIDWSEIAYFTTTELTTVTQTVALASGKNWFSTYVEITLADLQNALVAALPGTTITIKSQSDGSTTYNGSRWRGQLNSFDVTKMYKIEVTADCEIVLEGMPLDPAEHPVTIVNGANWIGFPFSTGMTVSDAFAGFAVSGDALSSQSDGGTAYNGTRWRGQLTNLVPGQGYNYKSAATEDRTFTFPAGTSKAAPIIQSVKKTGFMSTRKVPENNGSSQMKIAIPNK